jgi:hypothetical protein
MFKNFSKISTTGDFSMKLMAKGKHFLLFSFIAMAQTVFAQSGDCQKEKAKANTMKDECMEINKSKGTDEFNKCLNGLKAQVEKANKICEAPTPAKAPTPAPAPVKAPAPAKAPVKAPAKKAASIPEQVADYDEDERDGYIAEPGQEYQSQKPTATDRAAALKDKLKAAQAKTPAPAKTPSPAKPDEDEGDGYIAEPGQEYQPKKDESDGYIAEPKQESKPKKTPFAVDLEQEDEAEEADEDAGVDKAKKQVSALKGSLSACADEFSSLPGRVGDFDMMGFVQGLATEAIKVKAKAKIPIPFFGPGPDDKVTDIGISVGCLKAFPESLEEIKPVLIDVAKDLAKGVVASKLKVSKSEVPTDIKQLKALAISKAPEIAADALGMEVSEVPTNQKDLECLVRKQINTDALNVEENLKKAENLLTVLSMVKTFNYLENPSSISDSDCPGDIGTPKKAKSSTAQKSDSEGVKLGLRAGFNMHQYTDDNLYPAMGMGGGAGLAVKIPFTSSIGLYAELAVYYRQIYSYESDIIPIPGLPAVKITNTMHEYAISVPILLQFSPIENLYLAAGAQVDIPRWTTKETNGIGEDITELRGVDVGAALGLGYMISPNFGIDLRGVIGVLPFTTKDGVEIGKLNHYGLGASYFF